MQLFSVTCGMLTLVRLFALWTPALVCVSGTNNGSIWTLYSDYDIYQEVLVGDQNPSEAVNHLTKLVNEAFSPAKQKN